MNKASTDVSAGRALPPASTGARLQRLEQLEAALDAMAVTDREGCRLSFNLNLYESGRLLSPPADHYGIEPQALEVVTQAKGHCRLDHLSGGRDQRSEGFLTAYYENEPAHCAIGSTMEMPLVWAFPDAR